MSEVLFLVPCSKETKLMLKCLKWEASATERRLVSYDEVLQRLMACGSARIVGGKTLVD